MKITLYNILMHGTVTNDNEFKGEFTSLCKDVISFHSFFDEILESYFSPNRICNHKYWRIFLRKHKFIESLPTYQIGDKFKLKWGVCIYLLCQVDRMNCFLINIDTGDRLTDPIRIQDPLEVAHEEMLQMTSGASYELL